MRNPIRRNKNIGTAKQGHGQDNKMEIPFPFSVMKSFHERLTSYTKESRDINGNRFDFVVEQTREGVNHACTVNDIAEILKHIPPRDYGRLNLIILRQPKRKEEILSSVWGRLIHNYELEGEFRPAVILEAVDLCKKLKWSKKLIPDMQKDLERLKNDGHEVVFDKRHHIITCSLESVRNTQLYRTLLYEIGHYKLFLKIVGEGDEFLDFEEGEEYDRLELEYEKRDAEYDNLAISVRKKFAYKYAEDLSKMLRKNGAIPFERMEG